MAPESGELMFARLSWGRVLATANLAVPGKLRRDDLFRDPESVSRSRLQSVCQLKMENQTQKLFSTV